MNEKNQIFKRLIDFQKSMPAIKKNAKNPFFKSDYASLEAIQIAIQEPLAKAGLGYYQEATPEGLKTTIFDVDGNTIQSTYPAVFQGKPQDIGSAVTYAKRYSLTAMLGLIIEGEDDDGQTAQKSDKQSYKKKDENIVWLTPEQYYKAKGAAPEQIKKVIAFYSGTQKDGATYRMSKNFRGGLQKALESKVNLPNPDNAVDQVFGEEEFATEN